MLSTLASWPGVFRNEDDDIVGFWGLGLGETTHQLDVNGIRLYAWCAWEMLFLPGILQAEAVVQTVDPQSGEPVTLTVSPNKVLTRLPEQTVVSFLAPDGRFEGDVITSFCHYIHFFTNSVSAGAWLTEHDATFLLELDDAFDLGTRLWREGSRPGRRRRTPVLPRNVYR